MPKIDFLKSVADTSNGIVAHFKSHNIKSPIGLGCVYGMRQDDSGRLYITNFDDMIINVFLDFNFPAGLIVFRTAAWWKRFDF